MASDRTQLNVAERTELGSRTSRRMRREGIVPGVVYSGGAEARPFKVSERDARVALASGQALIDLQFEGGKATIPVVVKEQQRHPVRGTLVHLDLHEVDLKQKIQADVTIELHGADVAPGVKLGAGILEHVTHEVTIEALPTEIPESIVADVSAMEIGDTLQLSAIEAPEGVTFAYDDLDEVTIATLSAPRVQEVTTTEVEEETELVGSEAGDGEGDSGESAEDGDSE